MCNAVSTSEWWGQKRGVTQHGDGRRFLEGGSVGEQHRKCCGVTEIKSNSFWCTLETSSSSTSRLSSVSYRLSYRYQQCARACVCVFYFIFCHSSIRCLVFIAPSVLSEDLLFFYCRASGDDDFFFVGKKICGFLSHNSKFNFSLWKGLESLRRARIQKAYII